MVEFCETMANAGKIVVVAALDGTYQRSGFGDFLNLVPLAENIVKLTAVCMRCYGEAAFTQRLGSETEVELIGGKDKYMAVCRECYRKYSEPEQEEEPNAHGNRVSSPFHHLVGNKIGTMGSPSGNNKSPLKTNNSPDTFSGRNRHSGVSKAITFSPLNDKENNGSVTGH